MMMQTSGTGLLETGGWNNQMRIWFYLVLIEELKRNALWRVSGNKMIQNHATVIISVFKWAIPVNG